MRVGGGQGVIRGGKNPPPFGAVAVASGESSVVGFGIVGAVVAAAVDFRLDSSVVVV